MLIPLFGKTIPKSLMKKIYEKQVKQIYILLDSDAIMDSIKMTDSLMKMVSMSIMLISQRKTHLIWDLRKL